MTFGALLYALRWLIHDTFRQSLASSAFWLLLLMNVLAITLCLSVNVDQTAPLHDPDDIAIAPDRGSLTLGFGLYRVPLFRDKEAAVHFLQVLLGEWLAGTVGLLITLIWTAGFVPAFVEPSAATVMLAKPMPRWVLLFGKVIGVLVFVAFQAAVFVIGTWAALGIRTGIWKPEYLLCLPLLLVHFSFIYAASVLLAVWTRSTVACVFGSIVFWLLCYGMNFGRHAVQAMPDPVTGLLQTMVEVGYWCLPKPADAVVLLHRTLDAGQHFNLGPILDNAEVNPVASLSSSLAATMVLLILAAYEFRTADY